MHNVRSNKTHISESWVRIIYVHDLELFLHQINQVILRSFLILTKDRPNWYVHLHRHLGCPVKIPITKNKTRVQLKH